MRLAMITLLLLCAGTAEAQDATPPPGVTLVDARPAEQKKTKIESLTVWRCMYGSQRLGDTDEGVQRIPTLQQMLDGMSALSGRTVTLRNYVVHINNKIASRNGAANMMAMNIGGAVGGGLAGATSTSGKPGKVIGCAADDLLGGYVSDEIPLTGSPIVTVIDLDIDGKPLHFRSISDTKPLDLRSISGTKDERKRLQEENQQHRVTAHDKTLAGLQAAIENVVSPTPSE